MDGAQASHNAVALTRSTFYHQRGCWVVKDSAGDGNKISASYCVYAHNESSTYFIADEKNSGLCSDNYSLFCDDLGVNHTRRTGWLAEDKVNYSLLNHDPDANTTYGILLGAGTRHDIDLGRTFWSVVEGELFFLYLGPHSLAVDIGGLGQDAGALPRNR